MIHPLRVHYDKLLLVLALAALGCSLDWVRRQQPELRVLRGEAVNPSRNAIAYEPPAGKAPLASAAPVWPAPRTQSRGEGWLYEVFTPPTVHYDPGTRIFGLTSAETPSEEPGRKPAKSELGVGKPEAFRLQLAGYFGGPEDYLVAFRSPLTADTLLARVGHRFADLELTFRSFAVRKVLVTETESGPVHEVAALATMLDERNNREVVLDSRAKRFTDAPIAQTASSPGPLSQAGTRSVAVNRQ